MRKIIAIEFITLDGVIQSPGAIDEDTSNGFDLGGWISGFDDDIISRIITEEMNASFDLLLGRKTFDIWAAYWPLHPEIWPKAMEARKYVVSNSLSDHEWKPVEFIHGDDAANRLRELKKGNGKNLHLYGSSRLFQFLYSQSLIDEIWLKVYPLTLGKGKKLFSRSDETTHLELLESITGTSGIVSLKYKTKQKHT